MCACECMIVSMCMCACEDVCVVVGMCLLVSV